MVSCEGKENSMERRKLGGTGLTVSAIGLGCMGMSEFYGAADDAQSAQTLQAALDAGIDFLDTADTYGLGHNEELVGRFLRESGRRGEVTLATKFGIVRQAGGYERRIDNSPAYVRQACEASLKRLGLEAIDLYYCHRRNPETPVEDLVGAMADLVREGKVRALGLSEVSPSTLRKADAVHPIAAVQSEYSLWTRDVETEMLGACRELGVTLVAYSPLGRAFLTGAISSAADLPEGDFRRNNPRFAEEAMAQNKRLADALAVFAARLGATPAQVALSWLLRKNDNVVPIPGTKRPGYVAENAAAADLPLSIEDVTELDAIFKPGAAAGERYTPEGMKGLESSTA
jgi:aryl-alcohol dehydrogenase-like predicted oxidoreductase